MARLDIDLPEQPPANSTVARRLRLHDSNHDFSSVVLVLSGMSLRVWRLVAVVMASGCYMGPSDEALRCYQACGREKDGCLLQAATAQQIQACDQRSSRCSAVCQ